MNRGTAHGIVKKYHQAWTTGDIDTAMSCVSKDIICRAPGIDLKGINAYRDFIGGFASMLTGIGEIAEFSEGDGVALFYYPQTAVTATTPAAEYFTVEDGLIVHSVLIFDRMSYRPTGQA